MRGNSQKHDGFIGKVLTEAEFTVRDGATFFTDDKNYAEVSVYPAAPASLQVISRPEASAKASVLRYGSSSILSVFFLILVLNEEYRFRLRTNCFS